MPRLSFVFDESIEGTIRIHRLLDELKAGSSRPEDGPTEAPPTDEPPTES
jgi:hypothetical protein